MKGIFYSLPLDFRALTEKKEQRKISIDQSIAQFIMLLVTTSFGECKFDETFGCNIWEIEYDFLLNENKLREYIITAIKDSIKQHEPRIASFDVKINLSDVKKNIDGIIRVRKRLDIAIKGTVVATHRPFAFSGNFFMTPFSY